MKLRLFTDMDRTVIPNGEQPEAVDARSKLTELCATDAVTLIYVTGRHLSLMQQAIDEYQLPEPDFAITDVGTRIYQKQAKDWQAIAAWEAELDKVWQCVELHDVCDAQNLSGSSDAQESVKAPARQRIVAALKHLPMQLQVPSKQHAHKVSYDVATEQLAMSVTELIAAVNTELERLPLEANIIWSIDETTQTGLLDILPPNADKLHAIKFLISNLQAQNDALLFAGDSGNDLQVLASDIPAVLVANATPQVKQQAQQQVVQQGNQGAFYQALNREAAEGNYSAGVLQGVAHFYPEFRQIRA